MRSVPDDIAVSLVRSLGAYIGATPTNELPGQLRRFKGFRQQTLATRHRRRPAGAARARHPAQEAGDMARRREPLDLEERPRDPATRVRTTEGLEVRPRASLEAQEGPTEGGRGEGYRARGAARARAGEGPQGTRGAQRGEGGGPRGGRARTTDPGGAGRRVERCETARGRGGEERSRGARRRRESAAGVGA